MAKQDVYIIAPEFASTPNLITKVKGELVNLKGKEVKQTIPARKDKPEYEATARGATQKDLAFLYGEECRGNWKHMIIKTQVDSNQAPKA